MKAEHPFWGDRRIWAHLRFVEQLPVNKKRILRLMREHALLVTPNQRLKAKRTPSRSKPKPIRPHEWWGIDMTKVLVAGVGWVSIVIGLDWYTKAVVGHDAGLRCTAQHWLEALDMAVNRQFPQGVCMLWHTVALAAGKRTPGCTGEQPTLPEVILSRGLTVWLVEDEWSRGNGIMVQVSVEEIQQALAAYLHRGEAGETVVIVRAGQPIAAMKPVALGAMQLRPFGLCAGEFTVPANIDAPLPEDP